MSTSLIISYRSFQERGPFTNTTWSEVAASDVVNYVTAVELSVITKTKGHT